jgi:hypothetical protein
VPSSYYVEEVYEIAIARAAWTSNPPTITLAKYQHDVGQGRALIKDQGMAEALLVDYSMTKWQSDWICVSQSQFNTYFHYTRNLTKANCVALHSEGGGTCLIKPQEVTVRPTHAYQDIVRDPNQTLANGQPNPLYEAESTATAPFSDTALVCSYSNDKPVMGDGSQWMKVAKSLNYVENYPVTATGGANGPSITHGSDTNLSGSVSVFGFSIGGGMDYGQVTSQTTLGTYSATYTHASQHWYFGDTGAPEASGMFYSGPNTTND